MAELVIKLVNGELAGKTMQGITKEVNAAAVALKKAEVGTQAWVDANKKLDDAKKLQGDLKKQIESTTDASNQLKAAWNKLPGAQYFNQIGQSFGMMKQGVGGLVTQFGVLKTAIAATGIGLLIIAFTTLVGWFKKTDEGATLLSGILRGFGTVVDLLFGKMIDIGKQLFEAFNNPKQLLIDLVEFIGNNLLNRLKAFVVIWDGIKNFDLRKVTDGFIQFGTGITDATAKMAAFGAEVKAAMNEGIEFEKELDRIGDRARELSVLNKQTEKEVDRLMLQSKNVGLTYKERIELLDKASVLELRNHADQLKNARDLEALRAQEIADNKARNINSDELAQGLADAQIARIELEKQSIVLQEKIANRREALTQREQDEIRRAAEQELKVKQNLEMLQAEAAEDGMEQEIAMINASTQVKIEALVGSEAQILEQQLLLAEIAGQQVQAVRDRYAAQELASKKKLDDDKAAADKKSKTEQEERDKKEAEGKKTMADAQLSLMATSFGAAAQLLSQDEKARKKNADLIKAFTIGEIIANTQREISGYYTTVDSVSTLGVTGSIKAAIAIIRAGLAIQRVSSQQFGMGGIPDGVLRGPSHAQGGIPLEAEGQEIILTKGVFNSPGLRSMASAINVAGGGRSFATGGLPSNPFDSSRGPISSGRAGGSAIDPIADLKNAIVAQTEAINRRIDRIKVVNNLQDTESGLKTLNTLRSEADV